MDEITLSPQVHLIFGALVLFTLLAATAVTARGALVLRRFGRTQQALFIAAQIVLMVQALIGVKLLDQGMGTLQKYVHYLGGLGALGLLILSYWLPRASEAAGARRALGLSVAALVFAGLTFFVGGMYVRG